MDEVLGASGAWSCGLCTLLAREGSWLSMVLWTQGSGPIRSEADLFLLCWWETLDDWRLERDIPPFSGMIRADELRLPLRRFRLPLSCAALELYSGAISVCRGCLPCPFVMLNQKESRLIDVVYKPFLYLGVYVCWVLSWRMLRVWVKLKLCSEMWKTDGV